MRRSWVVAGCLLVGAILLAGCDSNDDAPSRSSETSVSSTPSPSPTPGLETDDIEEIEQGVRDYFEATGVDDLKNRARYSTGDANAWATWLRGQYGDFLPGEIPSEIVIDKLEFLEGDLEEALVDFKAKWTSYNGFGQPVIYNLSGPVVVINTDKGWKVSNYNRDGRDQEEAVFSRVKGYQEVAGVALEVQGVVVQKDYVAVFTKLTNRGDGNYQPYGATIVDVNGRQLSNGTATNLSGPVLTKASVLTSFVWDKQTLARTSRQFRMVVEGADDQTFDDINFDLTIKLRD